MSEIINNNAGFREKFDRREMLKGHLKKQETRKHLKESQKHKHADLTAGHEMYVESKRKLDVMVDEMRRSGKRRVSVYNNNTKQNTLNLHMQMMELKAESIRDMKQESARLSSDRTLSRKSFSDADKLPVRKGRVKFSQSDGPVRYYVPVEDDIKKDIWYTRVDLESFHREIRTTVTALCIAYNDPNKLDQNKFCLRGCERHLDSSMDRRKRHLITRMMRTQREYVQRRSTDSQDSHLYDDEHLGVTLSKMSSTGSAESVEEAIRLATEDANDCAKITREANLSQLPEEQPPPLSRVSRNKSKTGSTAKLKHTGSSSSLTSMTKFTISGNITMDLELGVI